MKRLAQKATKKKKTGVGKPAKRTGSEILPPTYLTIPGWKNISEPAGEIYVKSYQFPKTIYERMRAAQVEKLDLFIEGMKNFSGNSEVLLGLLNRAPELHSHESRNGCPRWVYNSVFMADGQDRYEATDDLSFNVLGTFCPSCELSRRLVEFKPIHYEVPEEGQVLVASTNGFLKENWTWAYDPIVDHCELDSSISGKSFWKLSVEKFRSLLVMVSAGLGIEGCAKILGGYVCGHRRVYVAETPSQGTMDSVDFQKDFLDPISEVEKPRYRGNTMFQICVSELNPLRGEENVFYSPTLTLNLLSDVIYGLSLKMYVGEREFVFYCSEPGPLKPTFRELRGLEGFPEIQDLYPTFYVGMRGFTPLILFSLFYLNEGVPGEFTRVVMEDPRGFVKFIGERFGEMEDAEEFRTRLIDYKRNIPITDFRDSIDGLRKCLGGLRVKI